MSNTIKLIKSNIVEFRNTNNLFKFIFIKLTKVTFSALKDKFIKNLNKDENTTCKGDVYITYKFSGAFITSVDEKTESIEISYDQYSMDNVEILLPMEKINE